jgi:hypothetical protein
MWESIDDPAKQYNLGDLALQAMSGTQAAKVRHSISAGSQCRPFGPQFLERWVCHGLTCVKTRIRPLIYTFDLYIAPVPC